MRGFSAMQPAHFSASERSDHRKVTSRPSLNRDGARARLVARLGREADDLIDEVVLVGDKRFKERCEEALFEKKSNKAMLLAIHSMEFVKNYCSGALVLKDGRGRVFYDTDLACKIYASL